VEKALDTHWIGGWVVSRAGLDDIIIIIIIITTIIIIMTSNE
jgi:hypothetical protein